jgi:cell division transport system permease protein
MSTVMPPKLKTARIALLILAWLFALVSFFTLAMIVIKVIQYTQLTRGIAEIKNKNYVIIYLKDNQESSKISSFSARLKDSGETKSIVFVSKDTALAKFREQNSGNKELLDSIAGLGNPLPASIEVQATDWDKTDKVDSVINSKESADIIEKISYSSSKSVIEKFNSIRLSMLLSIIIGTLLILLNALMFVSAKGLRNKNAASMYLMIPFCIISLLIFPIGTILAILMILSLIDSKSWAWVRSK